MAKCVDSSHDGNGKPGAGIVFQATEKLLSAVSVLMDVCDDTGASRRGELALVARRKNQLIRASAKCDANVADLRRKLSQRDARIAELEAKLAAAARLARDSAEAAGEMAQCHGQVVPVELVEAIDLAFDGSNAHSDQWITNVRAAIKAALGGAI